MWIPTPVYERIPQLWFLLGLLFITGGVYLGFDYPISFLYIALGLSFCSAGVGISVVRFRYRRDCHNEQSFSATAD